MPPDNPVFHPPSSSFAYSTGAFQRVCAEEGLFSPSDDDQRTGVPIEGPPRVSRQSCARNPTWVEAEVVQKLFQVTFALPLRLVFCRSQPNVHSLPWLSVNR